MAKLGRPRKNSAPVDLTTHAVANALLETAASLGTDYIGSHIDSMTENEAIHILTRMIRDGKAGPQAPQFIKAILEIRASSGAAIGPPPPTNKDQIYARLRRLFALTDQATLDRAYTDHRAHPPEPASEASQEAPISPEATPANPGDLA